MPLGSSLFLLDEALSYGVGKALHKRPPAWVELQNAPATHTVKAACTREHMAAVYVYDIQQCCFTHVASILRNVCDHRCPLNLTNGTELPWWVWMANTGGLYNVTQTGVYEVYLVVVMAEKHVIVNGQCGFWQISLAPKTIGKSIIEEEYLRLTGQLKCASP